MKKLRPFRLIADWFSTVRGTALAALFLLVIFSGLHLLGAGTLYEMRYALLLAIVGLVAAGVRSFLRYVQRAVSLYAAQQRPPVEEASLPEARTAPERDFRTLADLYRRDRDAAAERAAQAERDRLDYFTLWVHQIKTPIAALDLMAQSDEPIDREVMRQETFKISQYADSALTFQRLQSLPNDLALSEVPLYPLCCTVVKKLRPPFRSQVAGYGDHTGADQFAEIHAGRRSDHRIPPRTTGACDQRHGRGHPRRGPSPRIRTGLHRTGWAKGMRRRKKYRDRALPVQTGL